MVGRHRFRNHSVLQQLKCARRPHHDEVDFPIRHVGREGVDVALRFGEVRDPDLIVRKVAAGRSHVVGAPAYLHAHGTPTSASDLSAHTCLVGFAGEFSPQRRWPLKVGGTVEVGGRLAANDIRVLSAAARAGLGLALVPDAVVAQSVASGELAVVLDGVVEADASISLVYADREFIDPKVRIFVDRAADLIQRRLSD